MKNRNLNHGDSWATPKYLMDELQQEFNFDFDPCPLELGEIAEDKDGLLIEWGERNFINPPYSRKLKDAFVKRAVEMKNNGKLCVLLLPVSTSTVLFHNFVQPNADEIRFLRGRVKFEGINTFGERVTSKCGMHDSMIVIMDGRK
jgi:site-specific DNA-methyltransferase (adenine-specific)